MQLEIGRTSALVIAVVSLAACREKPKETGGPYASLMATAVPKVESAIGLKFKTPPRIETRTKEQVREFLLKALADSATRRDLEGTSIAYKLLGMVPDTLDLARLETALFTEQIVGFYDPGTKKLYVVEGAAEDQVGATISHELVHALQDQYVNLDSLQKIHGDDDREMAAQSVIEGQAVYGQMRLMAGDNNVAFDMPAGWSRIRDEIRNNRDAMPVFASAPTIVQETAIFPYLSGAEFAHTFAQRRPGQQPFAAMPVSTEQIIHSDAYFGKRDDPTPVTFALGSGAPVYSNDLGEFETRLFLFQHLDRQDDAVRGAAGWGGDRYVVLDAGGSRAIAWATVWDTQADAADFYSLAQQVRDAWKKSGRSIVVTTGEVSGRPVVLWTDYPSAVAPTVTLANVRVGTKR